MNKNLCQSNVFLATLIALVLYFPCCYAAEKASLDKQSKVLNKTSSNANAVSMPQNEHQKKVEKANYDKLITSALENKSRPGFNKEYLRANYNDLKAGSNNDKKTAINTLLQDIKQMPTKAKFETTWQVGKILFADGQRQNALHIWGSLTDDEVKHIATDKRSVLYYNMGHAYRFTGQNINARKSLKASFLVEPKFTLAARDLNFLYKSSQASAEMVYEMLDWFDLLTSKGNYVLASEGIGHAIEHQNWQSAKEVDRLILTLVYYLSKNKVGITEYTSYWTPMIKKIDSGLMHTKSYKSLNAIYRGRFKVNFRRHTSPKEIDGLLTVATIHHKQPQTNNSVASLLKSVADEMVEDGKVKGALSRYAASWKLDTSNTSSITAAMNLLLNDSQNIDPNDRLLNAMVNALFSVKGEAYLGDDWPNILRMHIILGTIYDRKERWGNQGNPRSAIFQWQHAIKAHKKINPGKPAPGLYAMLAKAYKTSNPEKSLDNYISAAEQAFTLKQIDYSKELVVELRPLMVNSSVEHNQRISNLAENF